jgi:hypothetical protein
MRAPAAKASAIATSTASTTNAAHYGRRSYGGRIDLAVAAVMAQDRARHHAGQPRAAIYVLD